MTCPAPSSTVCYTSPFSRTCTTNRPASSTTACHERVGGRVCTTRNEPASRTTCRTGIFGNTTCRTDTYYPRSSWWGPSYSTSYYDCAPSYPVYRRSYYYDPCYSYSTPADSAAATLVLGILGIGCLAAAFASGL